MDKSPGRFGSVSISNIYEPAVPTVKICASKGTKGGLRQPAVSSLCPRACAETTSTGGSAHGRDRFILTAWRWV
jgi:hypothetical protein